MLLSALSCISCVSLLKLPFFLSTKHAKWHKVELKVIDESQEELSVPQSRDPQTNNCFPLLATGGPPGVIQRRGVGRRNGENPKAGQTTGAPMFYFMRFMVIVYLSLFVVKVFWL